MHSPPALMPPVVPGLTLKPDTLSRKWDDPPYLESCVNSVIPERTTGSRSGNSTTSRVPHFSRSLREVGLFADTLPALSQRHCSVCTPRILGAYVRGCWTCTLRVLRHTLEGSAEFSPPTKSNRRSELIPHPRMHRIGSRVPHFSRSLREVGIFACTLLTLSQRSAEFSPPTKSNR